MILALVAGVLAIAVLLAAVVGLLWLVQWVLNTEEGRHAEGR